MNVLRLVFAPARTVSKAVQSRALASAANATEVYAWGKGDDGQLGKRSAQEKLPSLIESLSGQGVTQVAAGYHHSLFLTGKGEVMASGKNTSGELGRGVASNAEFEVRPVSDLEGVSVKQIAAGGKHSLALAADGTVFSWGFGGSFLAAGALGHGDKDSVLAPKQISGLEKVKQVAAGEQHSLAVTESGQVFAWGLGEYGRLGQGDSASSLTPRLVEWLVRAGRVAAVSAGQHFSAALMEDGSVYMWGSDAQKQLGNADGAAYDAYQELPTKVLSLGAAVQGVRLAAGHKHTVLLDRDGNVWVWGNVGGFLPKKIAELSGKKITDVAAGAGTVFAVSGEGEVYSLAATKITDMLRAPVPLGHDQSSHGNATLVGALKSKGKTVSISAGLSHALAVVSK